MSEAGGTPGGRAGIRSALLGSVCADLLAGLDDAQREGVVSGEGLTVIEAGAGTGKTRTLTTRIAALIRAGEDPRSIVAVTFTRDAAAEMRERSLSLDVPGVSQVRFSTLHGLAAGILHRNWTSVGLRSSDFIIADDDEKRQVAAEAVEAVGLIGAAQPGEETEWAAARREAARSGLARIDRWKENDLSVSEMSDPVRERRSDDDETHAALYLAYQERLSARGLVDFGDLGLDAVRLLERDRVVLEAEAGPIRWLMVDEWQDTNRLQLRLVRLLASLGANVTVVGDDDQSLYSWRGAIPRLMERTAECLPEVAARGLHRVRLVTNRRCTEQVLAPANMVVGYNPRAEPKTLRSGRGGSPVSVAAHASDAAEGENAARRVADLIAAGSEAGEIAILGRGRRVLGEVGKMLIRHRVPHVVQAGTSFLERGEVMDVLAYLKLAVDPGQDLAFQRIVARPTRGLGQKAVERVLSVASARRTDLHETLAELAAGGSLTAPAAKGAAAMAANLSVLAAAYRSGGSSEDLIRYVLHTVGYLEWARKKDPPSTLETSVRELIDMARAQPSPWEFLTDAAVSGQSEAREGGVVHVGTLHGSKGREWDHVLLVGFEDGIIPSPRALREAEERHDLDDPWCVLGGGGMEEERRLFHVGLTRAKMSAHVSFAGMRRSYGKPVFGRASRLLHEAELKVPRVPRAGVADYGARKAARGQAKRARHELW